MIEAIFVSKKPRQELQEVHEVQVVFGFGITGDRHFKKSKRQGQNITFIETEAIDKYNTLFDQSVEPKETRRNIITRGIDLNSLVGVEFSIGKAKFRGVELCEPCNVLGKLLENKDMSKAEVIRAFLGSGGLRADVICTGILAVGMPITCDIST